MNLFDIAQTNKIEPAPAVEPAVEPAPHQEETETPVAPVQNLLVVAVAVDVDEGRPISNPQAMLMFLTKRRAKKSHHRRSMSMSRREDGRKKRVRKSKSFRIRWQSKARKSRRC
jgi:hypothetical protein